MEPSCIRHTELPGTSRLFADFSYHFDRVARFYRHNPHDAASYAAAAAEIEYPNDRRNALVEALRAQNGDNENLRRLGRPGTVAVVTGQQVGLFGGPAYTVYKAITAARLAQDLTARGIPAAPVFWLASEDHDFQEVSRAWVFDSTYKPVCLQTEAPDDARGHARPVGGIPLPAPPTGELRKALRDFPSGDTITRLVEEAYRPGATMAEAFRALLEKILPNAGLVFLDPLDPNIRAISAPLMRDALVAAPELKASLLERNRELVSAGYHAQVHLEQKTSLFFLLEGCERVPLRLKDSEFATLRDRAAEVSPNALLRPVMQDYLLPTVAYVGGPAELAYFAQSRVLYDRLLRRMPVVLSRCGFTLLDAHADKLLQRYKLPLTQVLVHEEALKQRLAHALVPESLQQCFDETSSSVERELNGLSDQLERFDPTLGAALQKSRSKILYQVAKLRKKTAREALRRNERATADAEFLHNLIYPHRHLQERFYSILPFLAQHGPALADTLFQTTSQNCPDHRILTL
ncbi:MAG: bacillithiol biosynthesis cysteine-adding enzyme BshC [Bryobacterales bacterium]|nr:bacillithiol biosynthesis cysteine-adding enzyme BshC [Bryobacterales bacterium]